MVEGTLQYQDKEEGQRYVTCVVVSMRGRSYEKKNAMFILLKDLSEGYSRKYELVCNNMKETVNG